MDLEALDRRAFFRGLMVTSAGLLVPRVVYSIAAPVGVPDWLFERMLTSIKAEEVTLNFGPIAVNDTIFPKINFRDQQITVQDWIGTEPDYVYGRMQQQLASKA